MGRHARAVSSFITIVLLFGLWILTVAGLPTDGAAAAGLPPLGLSATALSPGQSVTINGVHWPPGRVLEAYVCGGGLLSVSSDCDIPHGVAFGPADNGVIEASLTVTVPPYPVSLCCHGRPGNAERS